MTLTQSRPDLDITNQSFRISTSEMVDSLVEVLGARLVAYIAGVSETRAVREWANDQRSPREETSKRLRLAWVVATFIASNESPRVARTWMMGLNPALDDTSAARLIRENDADEVNARIMSAARAFVAS
jgi:hypothetical protein